MPEQDNRELERNTQNRNGNGHKKYIIFAFSQKVDPELAETLRIFVNKQYPNYTLVKPRTDQELLRYYNKEISIMLIDDMFVSIEKNITLIQAIKKKQMNTAIPILFITKKVNELVTEYNKKLLLYQETDSYIEQSKSSAQDISNEITKILEPNKNFHKERRKSRRYKINLDAEFSSISHAHKSFKCRLTEISLHGAIIQCEADHIFKVGEQLVIRIRHNSSQHLEKTEFIRVSAKILRLFIEGDKAAITWKHVNEKQYISLTDLILSIVEKTVLTK